ncbi:MAG: HAAS signaling domain-containing protein [Stackebrandtia sp.]
MRNSTQIEQVETYLGELDAALSAGGVTDRPDIVASIREHIESALGDDDPTPEKVDQVLRSLGDPLTIAEEAGATEPEPETPAPPPVPPTAAPPPPPTPTPAPEPLTRPWVPAVVILTIAVSAITLIAIVPAITLLIGLAMLWISTLWTPAEKLLGTVLLPIPGLLIAASFFSAGSSDSAVNVECEADGPAGPNPPQQCGPTKADGPPEWVGYVIVAGLIAALAVSVAAAVVLYRRGAKRALEQAL